MDTNQSTLNAAKQARKYYKSLGEKVPAFVQDIINNEGKSFSFLVPEEQYELISNGGYEPSVLQESPNILASGGTIETSLLTNQKFNEFNTGGSHESNPNGGIPQGVGGNGRTNTVEEGETSFQTDSGKYVFSDRLGLKPLPKF